MEQSRGKIEICVIFLAYSNYPHSYCSKNSLYFARFYVEKLLHSKE